ncbi:hypothetical protein PSV08DRAFT_300773 [Bipolaris maydis]|uniref:uncharacterized protein n=1 Tax=Cochliobolus heterostrophus TaxID=5016 RepID=UPI0024D0483A|nr:hypothetical protein PSV08DRAFT_300773 [Bipolaris maydis]KAJ6278353.1 hypothetical protein J3E71DRAFT_323707 [Bipolaris maydis]
MAPYKGVDFLCTVGLWGFQAVSVYTIVGAILRSGGVKALLWVIGFLGALTSVRRWDDSTQSLAQGRFRFIRRPRLGGFDLFFDLSSIISSSGALFSSYITRLVFSRAVNPRNGNATC